MLVIDAGTAITISDGTTSTPQVAVNSTCNSTWNAKTTCTGTVTSVTGGDGIDSTGGTTPSIAVDSTVARTNAAEVFDNDVTVQGDLIVNGDFTCINTVIETTSAVTVVNHGTGPALDVDQKGANDIINFKDDGTSAFYIENGGNVGINDTNPNERLDVNGNINVTGSYKMDDADVINTGKCWVGAALQPTTDIADAYIASAATWNAKTTCTGTVTPTSTDTFTNKSGSNNQWTNDAGYTTCTGDITGVTTNAGISGGGTSGSVTIGLDATTAAGFDQSGCAGINCVGVYTSIGVSDGLETTGGTAPTLGIATACNTKWDQSGCAGLNCVGTTTASNSQTFTNKSGSNNQWTNDAGYTTCTGDITGVTDTAGLSTSGTSGTICIGIDATTAANFDQSGCAGINCVGTTTASNSQTFTNKSGSNNQWTNDAGYTTCTGDITNVSSSTLLSGGGASGSVTLGIDSGALDYLNQSGCAGILCTGTVTSVGVSDGLETTGGNSPTLGIATACNTKWDQSGCAGLLCTGTTTASNTQTFTNKSGSNNQWTNDAGYTTCVGVFTSIGVSDGLESTGGTAPTLGIATACNTKWDQSGCTGLNCVGDITGVTDTAGLSTAGTSGNICIGIDATTAANFDQSGCAGINCVGTTTASNSQTFTNKSGSNNQWTNDAGYTTCTGDITGVTTNAGISGGGASGSVTIGIDATTAAGFDQSGCAGLLCTGTTTASNSQTFTNKSGSNNQWTNDAGYTTCVGVFTSIGVSDGLESTGGTAPTLGIATACNTKWDQSGCAGLACVGDVTGITTTTLLSGGGTTGDICIGIDSGALTPYDQSGCPGLNCGGTTTPSNVQTFTNKSGSNSQWTNDEGYTTCTGDITGVTTNAGISGGGTSGTVTIGIDAATAANFDQSGCAGINCVGVITSVGVSTGLASTGGTAPTLCIDSTCNSTWNSKTTCLGTVTAVTGGNGITSTGGTAPDLSADFYGDDCGKLTYTNGRINLGRAAGNVITGADNISIGDCAAGNVITGINNVSVGLCAGRGGVSGSGDNNVSLGRCSGLSNITGDQNMAIGDTTLVCNTAGSRNVAIGAQSGFRITGSDNLVFGRAAGCGITTGNTNVAIGNYAHRTSTNDGVGIDNVAIGNQAMRDNVSGNKNVAIGFCANQKGSSGSQNISIGSCANGGTATVLTGSNNITLGEAAAWKTTSGNDNIALGFTALGCNTTGACNIAIGLQAGRLFSSSSLMTAPTNSIFIGCNTKGSAANNDNTIVIGNAAVGCGSCTAMIGNSSITVVCSNGTFSTVSDRRDKTCICDLEHGLEFIGSLKPKTFNMITDRNDPEGSISCKRHGFIAQDVLALEGDDNVIISKTNPDRLGYTGEHIIPILVKGMQEQQEIINELKANQARLEELINKS
jgi:flavin reductase (DIM6/NTAB) family NADH-FMN oxidoreductase RutF